MLPSIDLLQVIPGKIRSPLGIILGSPAEAANLVQTLAVPAVTCYQMDLYQAERLAEEVRRRGPDGRVETLPDLWDLPDRFSTLVYPAPQGGERSLKIDMIEQSFHVLEPGGHLVVLAPYEKDSFFPAALKKVFKRVHTPAAGEGTVFWCQRQGERPRRRHEVTFQVRSEFGRSLRFVSRPGVFSYGRLDDGARALVEAMEVRSGDRVLDLGCGCGTNGIFAGLKSGAEGRTLFVDSNVRAAQLAELNARSLGLTDFQVISAADVAGWPHGPFDVVLANPPYYAQQTIAGRFIQGARERLRQGGRFYLVTKKPDQIGPMVAEAFGPARVVERRGYFVLCAENAES
jgi:16S rRNA (guanine1207-N2)-methyltransferase